MRRIGIHQHLATLIALPPEFAIRSVGRTAFAQRRHTHHPGNPCPPLPGIIPQDRNRATEPPTPSNVRRGRFPSVLPHDSPEMIQDVRVVKSCMRNGHSACIKQSSRRPYEVCLIHLPHSIKHRYPNVISWRLKDPAMIRSSKRARIALHPALRGRIVTQQEPLWLPASSRAASFGEVPSSWRKATGTTTASPFGSTQAGI